MSLRALARVLGAYAVALVVIALVVRGRTALAPLPAPLVVVSDWQAGHRLARRVAGAPEAGGDASFTRVSEAAVGAAPISLTSPLFPLALEAGRDGVQATLDGRTAYLTPDDLLHARAYDHATTLFDPTLGIGTHRETVLHLLAAELGVTTDEVARRATVSRVRFVKVSPPASPSSSSSASSSSTTAAPALDRAVVREAVLAGAAYLARGVDPDGRYRYLVDPITGQTGGGYNWPRHAGTTYFLAQAAALGADPAVRAACLRAAARLRDQQLVACGNERCIADGPEADVGSSALALLAFTEVVRTDLDLSYRPAVLSLASFLRSMQREDGELRHLYDRTTSRPRDRQLLYYTGEAAFALGRAQRVTNDERDRVAASRALAYLTGPGWSFFGSRYFWSEEHWTCQATSELWDRAPDPRALDFCLRWHAYQRRFQGDDGAFSFGAPLVTPRTTTTASRAEGAAAALDVLLRPDGVAERHEPADPTAALLAHELDGALTFLLGAQLRPGPRHLFTQPGHVAGGMPASAVDLQIRIDHVQHAGSAMIRWLELHDPARARPTTYP